MLTAALSPDARRIIVNTIELALGTLATTLATEMGSILSEHRKERKKKKEVEEEEDGEDEECDCKRCKKRKGSDA